MEKFTTAKPCWEYLISGSLPNLQISITLFKPAIFYLLFWTDKSTGDRQEKTEWHNIVVFGKQAETCEKYLSKGSQIYVEGRLQTSNYEKEGQTHYMTKVVVSNFQFLGSKQDSQGGGGGGYQGGGGGYQKPDSGSNNQFQDQTTPGMTGGQELIPDDDIPF